MTTLSSQQQSSPNSNINIGCEVDQPNVMDQPIASQQTEDLTQQSGVLLNIVTKMMRILENQHWMCIWYEPQKDMKMYSDMDILNFWKEIWHRFAFSTGGRVLNKYRNSMLPSNVQALLCARNWIRGYELQDHDDGDFCGVEDILPIPSELSAATVIT
nr:zinc finger BED domain-containing protein DAYSLEEPER-like [Ipomoea batatas]